MWPQRGSQAGSEARVNEYRKSCPPIDHLDLPDGITKPYRRKPKDFRETYIRVIRRWIEEDGREYLRVARAEYVSAQRKKRRKRFVLGRTLSAVKPAGPKE
jgi:hypothetical protein